MTQEELEAAKDLVFVKQQAGAEDLMFGFGSTSQVREGDNVTINLINSGTIPYDSTRSIEAAITELFAILYSNNIQ